MATKIETELKDQVMWITFREVEERRPCTLDYGVLDQFDAAVDSVAANSDVRCAVIRAASEKFFVVGANINALQQLNPAGMEAWIRRGHHSFNRVEDLPVPVIACVGGAAMGGGLELAMACDFIIAGENATFSQPEAALGFLMGWGGTYRLSKFVGPARAKKMYYTGQTLSASEAYAFGLAAEVVAATELTARVGEMAASICKNSRLGIRITKEMINSHMLGDREKALRMEAPNSYLCSDDADTRARMEAFFASRKKK